MTSLTTRTDAPLIVEGLRKHYEDVGALNGVDFVLGQSEILALVGPSGCGKSTLLRTIAGLVRSDAGSIWLGGALVDQGRTHIPPERRHIGLVFQEHALFPHLTVADNVGFGLRDASKSEVSARVDEMLSLVSLAGYQDRYPHELSGGERQRVALARALAPRPALMLFDEPFASLDHNLRIQLRQQVVKALRATATPAVFVTHDQHEALAIGDRIAVMRDGKFVQLDTPPVVFHEPADRLVGSFMGEASFLTISDVAGQPGTRLGPVESAAPGTIAMVRPDDLRFSTDPTTGTPAEVVAREFRGTQWLYTLRLADETALSETVLVETSHLVDLSIGERGSVSLMPGHRQVIVPQPTAD